MNKDEFCFNLKMSMQLFYFNDVLYFNRDVEHLEKRSQYIYDDLFKIINIDFISFVSISKNTCELDSDGIYHILFNIHLYFINGELLTIQKAFVCDSSSCFKM